MTKARLLEIRGLRAAFPGPGGPVEAVRGVDFALDAGEVLGIVGESGSGKSVAMMALLQLLPANATVKGSARFKGRELVGMPAREIRQILGRDIGCIFQDPLSAFNPVLTIGAQIVEAVKLHDRRISNRDAQARAVDLLASVSIPEPDKRAMQYPHEFSGGMRQRAMIAMALANNPSLLIADEPTTALDVTVQAQILDLLQNLARERGIGMVLITHDLGVVAGMARDISVMYGGRVVEAGTADNIFYENCHPYTRGLIAAMPTLESVGKTLTPIEGTPPSIFDRPAGCSFAPRCPLALPKCHTTDPALRKVGATLTACLRAEEILSGEARTMSADASEAMT